MRTLGEIATPLAAVLRFFAPESQFVCEPPLAEVLRQHPRLVVAINHSTPLSWIPSSALLADEAMKCGAHDRTPVGIMDHFFFQVPFLKEVASFLTQSEHSLSFAELAECLTAEAQRDLVVFPEGSNCFFAPMGQIASFRSPRFIELAILMEAPILLAVHWGSEHWAMTLPLASEAAEALRYLPAPVGRFFEKRVSEVKAELAKKQSQEAEQLPASLPFNIPVLPKPIQRFEMRCELYVPPISRAKFKRLSVERRKRLVAAEGQKIWCRMEELLGHLKAGRTDVKPAGSI